MGDIPHNKALVERLKDAPFALVGVNTDDDAEDYKKRVAEYGVTWRSAWQGGTDGPIPTKWGIEGYPTVFVLDAKHVLRGVDARGYELEQLVNDLLAEMKEAGSGSARDGK